MNVYYYVFNPLGRQPNVKHQNMADAISEAKRLAAINAGYPMEVCQCFAIVSTPKPEATVFFMDGVGPEKPVIWGDKPTKAETDLDAAARNLCTNPLREGAKRTRNT